MTILAAFYNELHSLGYLSMSSMMSGTMSVSASTVAWLNGMEAQYGQEYVDAFAAGLTVNQFQGPMVQQGAIDFLAGEGLGMNFVSQALGGPRAGSGYTGDCWIGHRGAAAAAQRTLIMVTMGAACYERVESDIS